MYVWKTSMATYVELVHHLKGSRHYYIGNMWSSNNNQYPITVFIGCRLRAKYLHEVGYEGIMLVRNGYQAISSVLVGSGGVNSTLFGLSLISMELVWVDVLGKWPSTTTWILAWSVALSNNISLSNWVKTMVYATTYNNKKNYNNDNNNNEYFKDYLFYVFVVLF